MKMKEYLPIFGLILIILVSGCTNKNPKTNSYDGVVINEFSSDDLSLESGDSTSLYLEVENVGGVDAKNVRAYLFGIDGWNINPSADITIGDLRAPDMTMNTKGEIASRTWDITAPSIPQGVESPFPIEARVVYQYKTTSSSKINLYSEYEWKRLSDKGQLSQSNMLPIDNSNGPIHVTVQGPSDYEIRENSDNTIPITITFMNTGSGDPVKIGTDGKWDSGKLDGNITIIGPGTIDCGNGAQKEITEELDLRRNKPRKKSCILHIDKDELGNIPTSTITMNFDFDYNYFVSRLVTIKVIGTKQ